MPFDSNGTFNRVRNWQSDAAASIKIRSDYHDQHDADLASGLSNCITKDGRSQPLADIPMNQRKLTNLGEPSSPTDAATKNYVDSYKTYATGLTVTGANFPNGMLNFAATTGITGISWTNADMSWIGRVAEANKYQQRLAINSKADGTGTDVISIDKAGNITCTGAFAQNLSYDGSTWRVNVTGTGTLMSMVNGVFTLQSNDTVTTADNSATTLSTFFTVNQTTLDLNSQDAAAFLQLHKKNGTGNFGCHIYGMVGTQARWRMDLGDGALEGTAYTGSNFALYTWDNAGNNPKLMLGIDRTSNLMTAAGDIATNGQAFISNTQNVILGCAGGGVYLRPNGAPNSPGQAYVSADGTLHLSGHMSVDANTTAGSFLGMGSRGKNGIYGGYGANWHNFFWSSGYVYALVDNSNVGAIQMVCDYRTKKNVKALGSTWNQVKSLRPITYQYKAYAGITDDKDDDEIRWGFVAHELQGTLTHSAATFDKDAADRLQSPNLMVVVAALTKALQEAMTRIEALEAK